MWEVLAFPMYALGLGMLCACLVGHHPTAAAYQVLAKDSVMLHLRPGSICHFLPISASACMKDKFKQAFPVLESLSCSGTPAGLIQ